MIEVTGYRGEQVIVENWEDDTDVWIIYSTSDDEPTKVYLDKTGIRELAQILEVVEGEINARDE